MAGAPKKGPGGRERRSLDDVGKSGAQVIREAAEVLEEELAAGLIAARKVSRRLAKEQRVDKEEFDDAVGRFRSLGQDLIEMTRGRLDDLKSEETQALLNRLVTDAQGALDTFVDLLELGPEVVNRVEAATRPKGEDGGRKAKK
jgi:hypothetical protein